MTVQRFDGATFDPRLDGLRLTRELGAVVLVMRDGNWRTLEEIQEVIIVGGGQFYPVQSISARLRDCRKERFGRHTVDRRRRGSPYKGLFEYRLLIRRRRIIQRQPDCDIS